MVPQMSRRVGLLEVSDSDPHAPVPTTRDAAGVSSCHHAACAAEINRFHL